MVVSRSDIQPAPRCARPRPTSTAFFRSARRPGPVAAVWRPSHLPAPDPPPASALVEQTTGWWEDWVAGLRGVDQGAAEWQEAVIRSLITLRALCYAPTGGLVAAPTTSLPQQASGLRNWDYRYCWTHDAADAVEAFLAVGADAEAGSLLNWLTHAVSGPPAQVQAVYRATGERRMPGSRPGGCPATRTPSRSASVTPPQSAPARHVRRCAAGPADRPGRGPPAPARLAPMRPARLDTDAILSFLRSAGPEPDASLWEMRGPPRQFTHTKAMIWAAADSAITMIESFGDRGPVKRWRRLRSAVRADALARGTTRTGTRSPSITARPRWTQPASPPRRWDSCFNRRPPDGGTVEANHPGTGRQWRAAALPDPPAYRHRRPALW